MKANEINLNRFLAQNDTQFVIPVYQRNYDWTIAECKQLFDDILAVGLDKNRNSHFIGSIVFIHDDVYSASGIRELFIIDGQQRLTTVTLLYIALLALAVEMGDEHLVNRIRETYLINKFAEEEQKLKLRPTENYNEALQFLLRNDENEEFSEYSRLIDNYNYFRSRLNEKNVAIVRQGIEKLMFVEISLDRKKDDPQRIFESLNSTGLELSQSDLIRNYILMGLKREYQHKIYNDYWKHIERNSTHEETKNVKVSDFIRDYLTLENREIPNKGKVYQAFKDKYIFDDIETLEKILSKIKKFSVFYNKLINPINETDKDIRKQIQLINKLEINVAYPFLLEVYGDYDTNIISKDEFVEVLELVQSFAWRRFVVGLPTNSLNKIFMRLYEDVNSADYIISLQKALIKKKGTQRFPRNKEVLASLKERDVYSIHARNRNYLLERLENFENKEPVLIDDNADITVEHIFPQNPVPKWKAMLGEEQYNLLKEKYLNTISNLTLSGNNGKLGNKYFVEKRDMNAEGKEQGYKFSRLWLNKYLSELDKWDEEEIEKRFEKISQRFLQIWKYPDVEISEEEQIEEFSIFDAEDPTGKKLEYAIFFDQKLNIHTVSELYSYVIKSLFDLNPESFFTTDLGERLNLTKKVESCRSSLSLNDTYFIEQHLSSKDKFSRLRYSLTTMDLTDELLIRFSSNEENSE